MKHIYVDIINIINKCTIHQLHFGFYFCSISTTDLLVTIIHNIFLHLLSLLAILCSILKSTDYPITMVNL